MLIFSELFPHFIFNKIHNIDKIYYAVLYVTLTRTYVHTKKNLLNDAVKYYYLLIINSAIVPFWSYKIYPV